MLALALVPCTDTGQEADVLSTEISFTAHSHSDSHDHHSNNSEDDTCPPFCICSCCSFVIGAPEVISYLALSIPPLPGNKPSFAPVLYPGSFNTNIWSPPRS